jgi:cephalosporin-C deacetylase-like acetyl esterase
MTAMKKALARIIIGIALLLPLSHAQAQESPERRHQMVIEHLKKTAAEISARALNDIQSLTDWQRRRPELRRELLYMLGLDPLPQRTPLKTQIKGTIDRPGYRIEKLVFQSLPGLYVTGNFYLPANASGPLPAVLYVCGHSPHPFGAKTEYQDRAVWFATHGYACLIIDTLEFGEVAGLHHGIHDLNLWNWLSLGYTPAGVEVWNAMRAIDYLETRPEVDRRQIGMTGISGGGATTWFTAAVDERVSAAVPGVSTYTFGSQANHWVASGQCDCIYFHNTFLTDLPVVGALIAPRPLLFFNGAKDPDFPPDGYHEVYRKVKRIYDLYERSDSGHVREIDDNVGHSDTPKFRRETRQWMNRWLKNDSTPLVEEPNPEGGIESAETLACLSKPPRDAINYRIHNLFTSPIRLPQRNMGARGMQRREALIRHLREKVFRWFPQERISFATKIGRNQGAWAARYADYQEVEFTSEEGVRIRAQLLTPKGRSNAPLLIYAKRAGDSIYFMDLDELLPVLGRYAVLILNPRLTEHPVSAFQYAEIERSASWVGRTVAAMQVWDILRAIEWAVGEANLTTPGITLYGKGEMGILALYAGLFDERVKRLIMSDAPGSHWQGPALLNILRITDIAEVAGAFAPRQLVSLTEFPNSFTYTRNIYQRRGAARQFVRAESLPEALEVWKYPFSSNSVSGGVRLFVDPNTNSENPDQRMAYGLNVAPPWPDGGSLFINLPEHLEYMPGTKGIARHHDQRKNVWQVSADGTAASYDVESLTAPGVFFAIKALVKGEGVHFEMTITNRSAKLLKSIRPLLCFQYHGLKGFPTAQTDNFNHTFVIIDGKLVSLVDLRVKSPEAKARMAQVRGCADEHNWWAEEMGGLIERRIDRALTALTSSTDDRKVIVTWTPGKNLLSNRAIPCIHADPCFGDLAQGKSRTVRGELIFTRASLESVISEQSGRKQQER